MSDEDDLYQTLKPYAMEIKQSAAKGSKNAQEIIRLYAMVRSSPNDPGARGLCRAFFEDWRKRT